MERTPFQDYFDDYRRELIWEIRKGKSGVMSKMMHKKVYDSITDAEWNILYSPDKNLKWRLIQHHDPQFPASLEVSWNK